MSVEPHDLRTDISPFAGVRSILVPPDIVAVPRRSPPRVKAKRPWCPRPIGEPIVRAGEREWFSDRIFVEAQHDRLRSGLGASIGAHALVIALAVLLAASFERTLVIRGGPPAVMPAILFMRPIISAASREPPSVERSARAPAQPPPAALAAGVRPAAPVEAPASVEPETGAEGGADGVEGGVAGGVEGGFDGEPAAAVAPSPGPLRVGPTLAPPRKIKDVKPVYPPVALSEQARGAVIIDITIGTDGKVREATVVHSVPLLDQAALEAVRQWEYEPMRLNGIAVALIMTVIVNFTIQ